MNDTRVYTTNNIDQSAFLDVNGHKPEVHKGAGDQQATFTFIRTPQLLDLIEEYSSGSAMISAHALLSARRRLFHRVRGLERGGRP
jgi:hypothetical protein